MSIECNDDQDPALLEQREILGKTVPPVQKPTAKQLQIKPDEMVQEVSKNPHQNHNDPKVLEPVYQSEDSLFLQNQSELSGNVDLNDK